MKKLMMLMALMPLMALANDSFKCSVSIDDATAGSAVRKGTASWENTGSVGMDAPYVRVSAGEGVRLRLTDSDAWGKTIEFLAVSSTSPVSLLKANESGSLTFFCQADSEDGALELSWTTESGAQFPWADIGASLKPSYISGDAWTFALVTLKSRWGNTWDSYLACLRSDADRLAERGRPVNRIDRLMQIEVNCALGVDSILPVLASVTDASRSARGLGLSFTRSYSSSMYGRFTKGILGYGWTDNLSTYAELTDAATLVFRVPGGGSYSFTKLNGAWTPEDPRDKTVLTETTSAYKLSCQNGVVMTFAKSNMRTSSIADSSGNALTFTWNGTTLKKVTHTDGQSLSFAYSGGLLTSVTDDCGRTTQYSYLNSLLTDVTSPDGLVTSYGYRTGSGSGKPAGRGDRDRDMSAEDPVRDGTAASCALSRIIYPDGTTREFSYDTSSGLVSAVSVNDGKERTAIVRDGLQTTMTGPDGAETVITTGVSGEVLETVDALGGVSSQRYTADGLLASIISPSGLEGTIAYDAQGRVSKSVSPAGHETAFGYEDTFGNLTAVTDAKKHAVTYGYDAKGRGTSVAFADGSASTVEYNDRGDVVRATNRRGQTVDYAYDDRGRVMKKTWSTGRTFTYAYDAHGNVTEASDSETGTVTMEYDVADRLTRIVYPKGRGFTFAYDAAGRLVKRTSLDGVVERFAYDTAGRLASVSDGSGTVYLKNTYDATTGRLARQENGNGTSVAYLCDKLGRVVSIEHSDASGKIAESLQYCYDADGRCLRASSLQGEERYTYDKDGQLTGVDYPDSPDETFAYDAVGNRAAANGETYTVNALNQYTAVSDGRTFAYDKDGNLTKMTDASGTTTYAYDTLNRLTAVKNATAGIDWSCQYDVFGNRTSVTDHGVTTERVYLQGSLPSVAAEYVNGKLSSRHILVGAVRVADLNGEAASSPLVENGSIRYYHADLIGSTRLITDGDGAIVDRRAYKAFGESRMGEMNGSAAGYVGTLGVETDPTGLLFMRNRYYSPALGRFIQSDPIGMSGSDVNWYRYCGNDPSINVDQLGLFDAKGAFWALLQRADLDDGVLTAGNGLDFAKDQILSQGDKIGGNWEKSWLEYGTVYGKGSRISRRNFKVAGKAMQKIGKAYGVAELTGGIVADVQSGGLSWETAEAIADRTETFALKFLLDLILTPGIVAGELVAMGINYVNHHLPSNETKTLNVADGSENPNEDPAPGPGPSGGGGMIMSESDWLDITTNEQRNAQTETFSLGADVTLSDYRCIVEKFTGTVNGNGHVLRSAITGGLGVIFPYASGAKFNNVKFGKGVVRYTTGCNFTSCSASEVSFCDEISSATFTSCHTTFAPMVGKAVGCTFNNCTASITSGTGRGAFATTATEGCRFVSCTAAGSISTSASLYDKEAGGIVGSSTGCTFENCRSSVNVTGGSSVGSFAGQISGGSVSGCYASGLVVSSTSDSCIGGFAGVIRDSVSVSKCAATGNVSAPNAREVGGFVGQVRVAMFNQCYASGAVEGGDNVGGFLGNATVFNCSLTSCYAVGNVMANGAKGSSHVGGLAGMSDTGTGSFSMKNCYASGKVVNNDTGILSFSGGLTPIGISPLYFGMISAAQIESTMILCDGCYWNKTTTGQDYSGMGTKGLTSSEMKQTGKFSGWDFVGGWAMGPNGPYLRAVGKTGEIPELRTAAKNVVLKTASFGKMMAAAVESANGGRSDTRLYSYERYVVVKGVPYSFALSADGNSAISLSGLPTGFAFANGQINGTATAVGEAEIAITAGGMRKDVPFVVIDAPEKFAVTRSFRVVFDANGGMVSEDVRDVMANESVGALPSPTREEYDFVGWFTSRDGGTKISATTKVTADVVYYAHWTARMTSVYPELASVSLSKTQLGISDSLAVSFHIANPSSSVSSEEDNLDLYIDGVLTLGRHLDKMRSSGGLTSTIYVYSATMGPGTHTIEVKLRNGTGSFSNAVTVVNDKTADSRMDWAFHKLKSSEPDSFYLGSSLNDMSGRTSFTVGQPIFVEVHFWNANKVRNLDPVYVKLDLSTGASTSFTWNSMDPGVTGYLSDDVRMPTMLQNLPAGNYTLTATIDPYNNWWETDENNNVKRINFTVVSASAPHTPTRTESCYLYDETEISVAVDKGEVAPYAVGATVYDGYVVQDGVVKGTVQVKVAKGKGDKKTGAFTAKVTATVQLADGSKKLSFKDGVADAAGNVTGLMAAGHTLSISLGVNGMAGTMDGMSVDGARNVFSAKDADSKAIAKEIESMWVGAVNVVGDGVALAVSIAKKGKVKVSGTVNGAKVSATSQLIVGADACCVPVVITKKANLAFNLWLMDDGSVEVSGLEGVVAGKAGTLKSSAAFRMDGAALAEALPGLLTDYLPCELSIVQSKTKWVVAPDEKGKAAKAGKVAINKKTGEIDETKLGANPSALKLTYKSKDGSFKGSFKAYTLDAKGKIKSYTINVTGVMVGSVGYGTATLKKPPVSWSVTVE